MIEARFISSPQNPLIKELVLLQKKNSARKEQGIFLVEGIRELEIAIKKGYSLDSLFFCPEIISRVKLDEIIDSSNCKKLYEISTAAFEKVAVREGTEGIIALLKEKSHQLDNLPKHNNPIYLVLEAVEKPGNLGAILRSADAASISGLIVCDPRVDVYNPNVIRSSVGGVFCVPTAVCTKEEALAYFNENSVAVYATNLAGAENYHLIDYKGPSAIVVGTEADGLGPFWLENSKQNVKIPMLGVIDSLNVSNAAAILMFEVQRQRGFTTFN